MPAPAPLDSCLRRNDALGAGAHDAVRVRVTSVGFPFWGRALRQAQGERSRELVLRSVGVARVPAFAGPRGWPHDAVRVRVTAGRMLRAPGGGPPSCHPLQNRDRLRANGKANWCCGGLAFVGVPAFAGTRAVRVRVTSVGFPLSRDGRFANRSREVIGEGRATTRVAPTTHLHRALSRLRSPPSRGSARTGKRCAAGYRLSPVRRWGCAGTTRGGDGPVPRPCPGFPLSRERRVGGAGRLGVEAAPFRTSGFLPPQE